MSKSSSPLPLLLALGAGALAGLAAAASPATREKLPALGGARPNLAGAGPLPAVEIAWGSELAAASGELKGTVEQVPQTIREHLGFAPAQLHFRPALELAPQSYVIRLRGLSVASGRVNPEMLLALRTLGRADGGELPGEPFTEPATGRAGVWISRHDAGHAQLLGYDVLEPAFALALHVDTVLRRHLYELLSREEAYRLLDHARQAAPRTVEELTRRMEVGLVQKVLQNLLREQVSLRDLPRVLELLTDAAREGESPEAITESVRAGLARQLGEAFASEAGVLYVLPMGNQWDQFRHGDAAAIAHAVAGLRQRLDAARERGVKPVLLAPRELRARVRRALEQALPDLPVLAEHEVDSTLRIEPVDAPAGVTG